jgi:small nuclear ribonucleoprotein (snRNP)-like protein
MQLKRPHKCRQKESRKLLFFLLTIYGEKQEKRKLKLINEIVNCSFFKTLVDQEVTVELKNDISIRGTLKSVDQYLNIKLADIQVLEELKYPHLVSSALTKERVVSRRCGMGRFSIFLTAVSWWKGMSFSVFFGVNMTTNDQVFS